MNKNSLSQLNKLYVERCRQLSVQNQELQMKVTALEKAIAERNEIIEKLLLKSEKDNITLEQPQIFKAEEEFSEPIEEVETEVIEEKPVAISTETKQAATNIPDLPVLDDIGEYAAQMISQMVISSAKHSNIITSSNYENKKDLLNLIIGKCENAKYEISDVLQSQCSDENKKQMIEACVKDAQEYFGCVIEQK